MIREPAVAGRFYPGDAAKLSAEVAALIGSTAQALPAVALMAPHAGYMYSGAIAGQTWAAVAVPRRIVFLAPNHTGRGASASIWSGDAWAIPGGSLPIDAALRERLCAHAGLTLDTDAHLHEHAIEVHLPLARARRPDLQFNAICLGNLPASGCQEVGLGIARAIAECGDDVLLVASSDMSHYLSAAEAERLDRLALEPVLARAPEDLYRTVRAHAISMCGVVPMTVALHAANALGAQAASLVRYGHSGERSGDFARVVGYAGVVVRKAIC